MTRSRQLDDRIVEVRRARIAPRRVAWFVLAAMTVAAFAFIADSLRRSVAQLGAAVPAAVQRDASPATSAPPPPSSRAPPRLPPVEAALPSEQAVAVESESIDSSAPSETFELQELAPAGPLTGAEFAALVESGALGDVRVDAEDIEEMRRALDAAAFEAELEPSEP